MTHDKWSVDIRWWPQGREVPYNEWGVYKEAAPDGDGIREARISDSRPQVLTVETATSYGAMLVNAASIARSLDETITEHKDFGTIWVAEADVDEAVGLLIVRVSKQDEKVKIVIPRLEE